ncbi:MAG: hypothetical protein IRZ00_05515 [Gemmatimonadetes bacterium]|nr:hypothetical protein [Gemmatimonadota bacterium]
MHSELKPTNRDVVAVIVLGVLFWGYTSLATGAIDRVPQFASASARWRRSLGLELPTVVDGLVAVVLVAAVFLVLRTRRISTAGGAAAVALLLWIVSELPLLGIAVTVGPANAAARAATLLVGLALLSMVLVRIQH